ncbi:tryptophan--tRNA ligase [Proteiniclasticum ruminis]|uniref:Tryptophan--tRNA ligase n=1 Tax=Proteiniclasticum ruminis TaxID=398199 RepID=A0A1I5DWH8_9CLOT|nr:tryptophan--tRNA ligase [Proteiniclasticum ruminis]SFO03578.1 tryptophanyl-tRNA synthetase [Proteiniclasticum ruminis]
MEEKKKIVFSAIKPSGEITLGNYLGAIKNWIRFQDDYECYYCIADLHAITVKQEPKLLRKRVLEILAIYIASGLDYEKSTLFVQSHVPAHSEASWLLTCTANMGELSRMTQYKDKTAKLKENTSISAGLFNYPVLMAADILIYNTDFVPVGIDQKQHVELARDIAQRFNSSYSDTFVLPEAKISESAAKIMDLQDPEKKMSKSDDNENSYILVLDKPEVIRRKIARAVTDSVGVVNYTDEQPGVKNLINIVSAIKGIKPDEVVKLFEGKGYKEFKEYVAETIIEELKPVQEKANELLTEKEKLEKIYGEGAMKANYHAMKTLRKMQKKVGLLPPVRL